MNKKKQLCVKLFHCGNVNIANPDDRGQKNIFFMPMGFFPLARTISENGADVEIIHSDLEYGNDIREIIDFSTLDCVGFDCHWVNQSLGVIETAALIKKIKPETFIFLGGFTASLFCQEIIGNYPQIDAVIRGDGEVPIAELCRVLMESDGFKRDRLSKVQNLVWRSENNSIMFNDFSYTGTGADMDKLDYAAVEMLRGWEKYRLLSAFHSSFEPINSEPLFLLAVGRGCDFACTFCGGNCEAQRIMNNRKTTSVRSTDSVLLTIKKAAGYGFKTFSLDFVFKNSDIWYLELLKKIRNEKLDINCVYGSWKLPGNSLIDAFSETFDQVVFEISPETSNQDLRIKNKDARLFYSNEELENCLDYISTKPNVKIQLFFGYYLSHDDEETILNTIRYILQLLIKYNRIIEIEYSNFSTDPGSLLFLAPEKYDIDMQVHNFGNYIDMLKKFYSESNEGTADLTLFKPKKLSCEKAVVIDTKVKLLAYLFTYYRNTISHVLKKEKNPEAIVNLLKRSTSEGIMLPFRHDCIKSLLTEGLSRQNLLDSRLLYSIENEYEELQSDSRISKPTTQLFLNKVELTEYVEVNVEYNIEFDF